MERTLDELSKEEHEAFVDHVLKNLKRLKAENDFHLFMGEESCKIFGPVGICSMIASIIMGVMPMEPGDALSVLTTIGFTSTIVNFVGFFTVDNKYTEESIKAREELAQDAKEKIAYFSKKLTRLRPKGQYLEDRREINDFR